MKDYSFDNLPEVWCVDVRIEHPRLEEFKRIFADFIGYAFSYDFAYYGRNKHGIYFSDSLVLGFHKKYLITLDQFFSLIEQPKIEVGDFLIAKCQQTIERNDDFDIVIRVGKRIKVVEKRKEDYGLMIAGQIQYWGITGILSYFTVEKQPKVAVGDILVCVKKIEMSGDIWIYEGKKLHIESIDKQGYVKINNQFFLSPKLINEHFTIEKGLNLTVGNWLYCHTSNKDLTIIEGHIYKVATSKKYGEPCIINTDNDIKDVVIDGVFNLRTILRNATPEEIESVSKGSLYTQFKPTKNETVLVRNSEADEWQERLFVIEHEGLYFCAIETHAGLEPFRFIKSYEEVEKEKVTINAECVFEFKNFGEWVNKAQKKYAPYGQRFPLVALNTKGQVCHIGTDFMHARDNNLFPVKVYLLESSQKPK